MDRWLIYNIFKRTLVVTSVSGLGGLYILRYGAEAFLVGLSLTALIALAIAYCLMLFASD